jgi:adenylate cyclase
MMASHHRIKYGVVGHMVHIAAWIETFTVGGQIFVSDSIREAPGEWLVANGPLEAEGKGVGTAVPLGRADAPG